MVISGQVLSQTSYRPSYPKDYFRNPMSIPIDLSANFGELRKNHWHMGLDIRTNQKENLPVHAAAGGYIAQVGIRPQSFGRFIVINHPNGLSTLYAHLNDFYPALEEYVTAKQYEQESWAVELRFQPGQFPVSRGEFIAFSGNTGGSQGPHLHFEIMDTKSEKRLNPLLFNLGVKDNVPPTVVKLALYDRSRSVHTQSPILFNLKNTDSGYVVVRPAITELPFRRVSFAIQATDRLSGSTNPNGIFSAKLYVDEELQSGFIIDSIDYNETLYMNAHIDYSYKENGGVYLQQLSRMPGDKGSAYHNYKNDGVIELSDTSIHDVSIDVRDAHGNSSVVLFRMRYNDSLAAREQGREPRESIVTGKNYELDRLDFHVSIPEGSVYDDVPVHYFRTRGTQSNAVSDIHQLNDHSFPLHKDITVSIRPDRNIPEEWKDKLILQRTGKGSTVRHVRLENGWVKGNFDEFGKFQLLVDLIAPQLNEPGRGDTVNLSSSTRIMFTPSDNFGIVKKFRAELDGKWLRFTNDKSRNWIYRFDDRWSYGIHELKVTVEDHAGNITSKSWWIRREPYTPPPPKKKSVKKKKKGK